MSKFHEMFLDGNYENAQKFVKKSLEFQKQVEALLILFRVFVN